MLRFHVTKWTSGLANVRLAMITCLMSIKCEVLRELGIKGSLCDHEGCFNTRRVVIKCIMEPMHLSEGTKLDKVIFDL
jgi:hypothetical protein